MPNNRPADQVLLERIITADEAAHAIDAARELGMQWRFPVIVELSSDEIDKIVSALVAEKLRVKLTDFKLWKDQPRTRAYEVELLYPGKSAKEIASTGFAEAYAHHVQFGGPLLWHFVSLEAEKKGGYCLRVHDVASDVRKSFPTNHPHVSEKFRTLRAQRVAYAEPLQEKLVELYRSSKSI